MVDYNLGVAAGKIVIDVSQATSSLDAVSRATDGIGAAVKNKVGEIQEFGTKLRNAGAVGVTGFGLALNAASKFEAGLSAVAAVSGATEAEMKKISDAALRIGKDTSFSATEAASAMEELVKAGISVDDVLNGAADATVALAAAGGVSLPAAAEIAANAMNQFGLDAGKMPRIADLIAGAANASAISVGDFGTSLSQVGAVANLVGLSFDDTAVAIAEMGNAGIKGSDAGTSLKTMLMNLQPQTDKQTAAFKKLGLLTFNSQKAMDFLRSNGVQPLGTSQEVLEGQMLGVIAAQKGIKPSSSQAKKALEALTGSTVISDNAFFDAQGNLKSLREIQEILAKSTGNLTKEQQAATLETLFGADAIRAAAILAGEGAAGYDKLSASMSKVKAADVAKERLNNLSGSVEEMKGSFETMMIVIGQALLPFVTAIVDGITSIINVFNNLPGPVQQAIAIIGGIVSVALLIVGALLTLIPVIASAVLALLTFGSLGAVTAAFGAFFGALASGGGIVAAFGALFTGLGGVLTTIAGRIRFLYNAFTLLRTGLTLLAGPVGIVIAAVTGLAILGKYLYDNFTPFRTLVDTIAAALVARFGPAIAAVVGYFQNLASIFQASVGPAMDRVQAAFSSVIPLLISVGQAIFASILPHLQSLGKEVGGLVEKFQSVTGPSSTFGEIMGAVGSFIAGTVVPAVAKFGEYLADNLMPAFASVVEFVTGSFLPIFLKVAGFFVGLFLTSVINGVKGIVQAISGAFDIIIGVFNFFKALFTGNWKGMWDAVKQIVSGVFNVIAGLVKAFLNLSVLRVFSLGFALLRTLFTTSWAAIRSLTGTAMSGIRSVISTVWNAIRAFFSTILSGIRALFTGGWSAISSATSTAFNAIRTFIIGVWNAIRSFFSTTLAAYQSMFSAAWSAIRAAAVAAFNAIRSAITSALSAIRSAITSALSAIRSAFTAAWNAVRSGVTAAWSAIRSAVSGGISGVLGLIRALPGQIVSALGNLGGLLRNAGVQIMTGLLEGIRSGISRVKDLLNSVTGLIPDWKGPADTDKVLLKDNGALIMGGLIKGIESQLAPLRRSLAGVTASIPGMLTPPRLAPAAAVAQVARPLAQTGLRAPVPVQTVSNTFGDVIIPAKDLEEMRTVQDFFDRVEQEGRRRPRSGVLVG